MSTMYAVPHVIGEIMNSDKFGEYAFLSKTARVVVGDKLITEAYHLSAIAALQAQIAELQARQEWVSVTDHLPPKNTEVLICFAGQNTLVSTGQWTGSIHDVNGWCYPHENRGGTDSGDDPVVTHWQYAPEVPTTQPPEGR